MKAAHARQRLGSVRATARSLHRGFSVVELLIVIGVVIAILSTVLVGLSAATKRAQMANTEFLMDSVVTAIGQFKKDTGYLPPMLGLPSQTSPSASGTPAGTNGWGRDLVFPPQVNSSSTGNYWDGWSGQNIDAVQNYYSLTSMPEYLLGFGNRSEDGYGIILNADGSLPAAGSPGSREQPAVGIRNPGRDGVWGAVLNPRPTTSGGGLFASRNLASPNAAGNDVNSGFLKGKPLGPYLELKDANILGGVVSIGTDGVSQVVRPGEVANFDELPKVLVDYFGKPITYFRRGYINQDPATMDESWSLSDVFVLRPSRFNPGDAINGVPDANGDASTSRELRSAGFALMSLGPDQRANWRVRADPAGFNADNIVKTGD